MNLYKDIAAKPDLQSDIINVYEHNYPDTVSINPCIKTVISKHLQIVKKAASEYSIKVLIVIQIGWGN